jgi:hypothetical protein
MNRILSAVLLLFISFQGTSFAQSANSTDRIQELEKKIEELRGQLTVLATEVEKLRSGEEEVVVLEDTERQSLGLGPSAATVYTKKQGVSIAGYGEMLYEDFDHEEDSGVSSGEIDQLDFLRAVLYFGYRFNDRILFNSEIEFEHANTEHGGEVAVEFAHIDYQLNDSLSLRGGMILVPMGLLNEFHEPTVFLGARRTETERFIIPSTWRENGGGIVGRHGIFDYRAYLMTGLNAAGFSAEEGLREGRQEGAEAKIESPAFSGRVDVRPAQGILIGGSLYAGNSRIFTPELNPDVESMTWIGEAHAEYTRSGLNLRALYARASVDDVTELNTALGLTGEESIGESLVGGYVQAGYDFLAGNQRGMGLTPYLRFEKLNTQNSVPTGFLKDPANDRTIWTFGLEYRPIFNVVVKADYQAFDNDADSAVDQFNILLGYSF